MGRRPAPEGRAGRRPDRVVRGVPESTCSALAEDAEGSEESRYVEHDAGPEAFAAVVGQYAVDGLTEAQAMFYAVPRLVCSAAQMPVVRVLIDEMGCGNPRKRSTQLFRDLLGELGLPPKSARTWG